jgi:hypothetical protein
MQGLKAKLFLVLCITKGEEEKKRTRLHLFLYICISRSMYIEACVRESVQFFSYLVIFMTRIFLFLADAQGVGKKESKRINVN